MTQDRHNALKTALYEHIEQKKFSDDGAVLAWLITSLDEWVERLEGTFSWGRILQTDFFRGLMTNIEMIDEVKSRWELKERFPDRDWKEFSNAVTWLEKTRDREDLALVEKTYYEFWKRFAAISGENSDQLSQVEWWPPATLGSPIFLRISRTILLLGVLLLFGGIIFFVYYLFETAILVPAHFGELEGFPAPPVGSSRDLFSEASALCFCLSVVVFAVWALLNLWPKMRPQSQK